MTVTTDWAVVIPLSNEEGTVEELTRRLVKVMDRTGGGTAYFIIDRSSGDDTLKKTESICRQDRRLNVLWRPTVRNVVQAYLEGFRHAVKEGHDIILEMDGGLAHQPEAIELFLRSFDDETDCVFGSRFREGGSLRGSNLSRAILSKGGTMVANICLGTQMTDMTSGFQGFRRKTLEALLQMPLRSTGHFYQTEVRYLLRRTAHKEVPIHYQGDGRNVSRKSLGNALATFSHYFLRRLGGNAKIAKVAADS